MEKQEFRDALETMMGVVELEVMLCIVRVFNEHWGVRGTSGRGMFWDIWLGDEE